MAFDGPRAATIGDLKRSTHMGGLQQHDNFAAFKRS
jgi:hypothetical protein